VTLNSYLYISHLRLFSFLWEFHWSQKLLEICNMLKKAQIIPRFKFRLTTSESTHNKQYTNNKICRTIKLCWHQTFAIAHQWWLFSLSKMTERNFGARRQTKGKKGSLKCNNFHYFMTIFQNNMCSKNVFPFFTTFVCDTLSYGSNDFSIFSSYTTQNVDISPISGGQFYNYTWLNQLPGFLFCQEKHGR
jgi:hypothetical protein